MPLLHRRLGDDIDLRGVDWGRGARSSARPPCRSTPAGHVLGSAQIRVERAGEVWVFTGDFKTDPDPSCEAFELVPCDTFITEATFALPVYRWQPGEVVAREIFEWWELMKASGRPAVVFGLLAGQGAARAGGAHPVHRRGGVRARRGRPADRDLPRGRRPTCCRRAGSIRPGRPGSTTPDASSSPRPARPVRPGCAASPTPRPASARAGCACAATGAGAATTAGSCSRTTPTGRAC